MIDNKERLINGIIGFIVGDAMGVPIEFLDRKELQKNKVVNMISLKRRDVPKGCWSDDSSMVIATMKAIIDNKGNINYIDIMNNFMLWAEEDKFCSDDKAFGIGRTTLRALRNYKYRNEFKEYENPQNCGINNFNDNGNGSLMRILPIAYYCYYKKLNDNDIYNLVKNISSLTHSHNISIMGCYIYVLFVLELLKGNNKEDSYNYIRNYDYNMFDKEIKDYYKRILDNDISKLNMDNISSSGYIVDTLEAVIWCFMRNNNYKDSIIEAINLGNDSDTIGALVGGLSGIYYSDIPIEWLNDLVKKDYLLDLCNEYYEHMK